MCGVFLNNNVDLYTLCVQKDFNCYLKPFSTMISLTRLSKSEKNFRESGRNPVDSPYSYIIDRWQRMEHITSLKKRSGR